MEYIVANLKLAHNDSWLKRWNGRVQEQSHQAAQNREQQTTVPDTT